MARVQIIVFAHNEERRIAACLGSLPLGQDDIAITAVVNGSSDATADIVRDIAGSYHKVQLVEYRQPGKAPSWNRFVLDQPELQAETFVFVDGDAVITPGSVAALEAALAANPHANAASGLPCNGRRADYYRSQIIADRGMFGDLYALRGAFVERMRRSSIRLPDDVIGEDGLVGALVKTNLGHESAWDDERIVPCSDAGFICEPTRWSPSSIRDQYRRMMSYALRHFQNRIITDVMRSTGARGLPRRLTAHYDEYLPSFAPRGHHAWWWFDHVTLQRMAKRAAALHSAAEPDMPEVAQSNIAA